MKTYFVDLLSCQVCTMYVYLSNLYFELCHLFIDLLLIHMLKIQREDKSTLPSSKSDKYLHLLYLNMTTSK